MRKTSLFFSAASLLTLAVLIACAPAKWQERNADGSNSASGGPGTPVQAPGSQSATEIFEQDSTANKVDILIVNDNSASMELEQTKMAQRFASFVSELKGIDYRIAMTTTDLDSAKYNQDGRIMNWTGLSSPVLTPSTTNASSVFANTISRPETVGCGPRKDCPSGNEQPLKAIVRAIEQRTTANKSFFRDGVDFVSVILTDEDEMSDGLSASATTATEVIAAATTAWGTTKRFAAHGLVIIPTDDACLKAQAAQPSANNTAFYGTHVADLASRTGGSIHSICDTDYAKDLQSISGDVRALLATFDLKAEPRAGSVNVTFVPNFTATWTLVGAKIVFNPAPPAGTKITVTYKY